MKVFGGEKVFFLVPLVFLAAGDVTGSPPKETNHIPQDVAPLTSSLLTGHLKYVAVKGSLHVYDMDNHHQLVKKISLPEMLQPRGIAANAETDLLYIPSWGNKSDPPLNGHSLGFLLCMDLKTEQVLWIREYEPSIDSLAITPDGRTLYMPSGEEQKVAGFWFVLEAKSGQEITRIPVYKGAHNTIVSRNLPRVYFASLESKFLYVADTKTHRVIKKIGPFGERIRPFAINGGDTLAFVTVNFLSGFEVADINTGQKLYRVQVEGFPWVDPPLQQVQSHGVALSPDEREVWVVDAYNRMVHIFDATGLPNSKPLQIASIIVRDSTDPGNLPKWINFSRDGRWVHVSTGMIIDAKSRVIVAKVIPSRYFIQIDMERGEPVQAYSRYGIGYGDSSSNNRIKP